MRIVAFALVLLIGYCPAVAQDGSASPQTPASPAKDSIGIGEKNHPQLDLTPGPDGKLTQEQMRELTRTVAQNYRYTYQREREYTFVERDVENSVGGNGNIKSTEIKTFEVLDIYGEQVRRMIAKEDKPLDAKDAAKEEEKIQKIIDKRKNESEDERKKREQKEAKEREDSRKFVTEIADTFNFTLVGTESYDDRETWVIDGDPRPDAELHDKDSKFLSNFRGRLWIDKSDLQLAKMDIEAIDTASVGWVLARIHKGTRVTFERTRMTDEIWLPRQLKFKLDARVALFKGYKVQAEQSYHDYKKFRASSKIVGVGEIKEDK
jgi:hypothetical protein